MLHCIEIAKQVSPTIFKPYVGAMVLSQSGEILAEGKRDFYENTKWLYHAERAALESVKPRSKAKNGIIITTLEPCVESKENQLFRPCSKLIKEYGISTVIFGCLEKSRSNANGDGINALEKQGIEVIQLTELSDIIQSELMPDFNSRKLYSTIKQIISGAYKSHRSKRKY